MDQTGIKILHCLKQNSRSTMKEIGENVGLTSPAVSEHIRKLYYPLILPMENYRTLTPTNN